MYGGTKSELERLVSDASELTGEALDPSKFSDVIKAIHAVQENMGITGTTALEAATTIEGSVNTMKASWDNWLTGLGRTDADMGQLTDQLLESLGNVANNVGPVVQRIAQSLSSALPSAISGAVSTVGPVIAEALAGVMNSVGSIFGLDLNVDASGIISMFQSIATALQPIIDGIGSTLGAVLPSVVSGFQQLAASVGPALSVFTTSAPFVTTLGQALSNLATAVLPPLMSVIGSILPLLASIANAILPPIISFITPIASLLMNLAAAVIPPLTAAIQFLTPVIQFLVSAAMTVMPIFSGIQSILSMLTTTIQPLAYTFIPAVGSAFGALQGPLNAVVGFFNGVFSAINSVVYVLGSVISLAGQAASALANIAGGAIGGIGSLLGFRTGGFTSGPYIAGEDPRYPNEAVISFNPAYRAQNLRYWAMAGHMLGASPSVQAATSTGGGGASISVGGITFAPNITVRGNASKDDFVAALREVEPDFVDFVVDAIARRTEAAYAL